MDKGDLNVTSKMEKEAIEYIRNYGSKNQKAKLQVYK